MTFDHDHAALEAALDGAVDERGVDYAIVAARRELLDGYLKQLESAPVATFSREEQLAFWVNAYNALTIDLVLDEGRPASIRELDGGNPWDARRFLVGGQRLTLNEIEHERARKLADGRVHAVLNCAARGCPPLPPDPLVPTGIEAQLDAASARWARTTAFQIAGDRVRLSRVFEWYGADFAGEVKADLPNADGAAEAALWFLARFVDPELGGRLTSGGLVPEWAEYDWALNQR